MKKKICIMTTVHFYNDNRVYYKEVLSLKKLGYDVTYITTEVTGEIDPEIHVVEFGKDNNTLKRIFSFVRAFNVARKQDVEIVHFQDPELIPTGLLLKWFTNKKVIYDVHEDYPSQMLTKFYIKPIFRKSLKKVMQIFEWIASKTFDHIIVADDSVYKHFPKNKTTILYNYPSVELLRISDENIGDCKKEYDIIFPGSMAIFTAKLILDVVKLAKDRGINLKCLLISPFHFPGGIEWVKKTTNEYGITENVTLMGRIPPYDVPRYLKSTKIGLIPLPDTPKMRANIPTKMFEYMYYRLPVLTGDLPPCGQFMKKDNYGYLLPVDSVEEYTNKIIFLLHNPEVLESLGNRGHELVVNEYNWEKEEVKLSEVYKKILG